MKMSPDQEKLADLFLELANLLNPRLAGAKRVVRLLDQSLPLLQPSQQQLAIERIRALETKWGSLLDGAGTDGTVGKDIPDEIAPEHYVLKMLSTRKYPQRVIEILKLSAQELLKGETSLTRLQDAGYRTQVDSLVRWVNVDTYAEWLVSSRVAVHVSRGKYEPGPAAEYMASISNHAVAACLKRLMQMRADRDNEARKRRSQRSAEWKRRNAGHGLDE